MQVTGRCSSTGVTCSIRSFGITIPAMRFRAKTTAAVLVCGLVSSAASLNSRAQEPDNSDATVQVHREKEKRPPAPVVLSPDDGLSVIAAALDAHVQAARQRDCSHLVHAIYLRAGFPYPYASSSDLYDGADDFQRVTRPQPGDLVVWPGHVGIVVNPAERSLFQPTAQRSGGRRLRCPVLERARRSQVFPLRQSLLSPRGHSASGSRPAAQVGRQMGQCP